MKATVLIPGKVLRAFFFCSLLSILLAACATTQDVDMLSQNVNKLQRDYYALKSEIDSMKEKTAGVVKEDAVTAVRQSQAEIQASLSDLSRDLQNLSGRFDENKYFVEKTLKNSVAETDLMKSQITAFEGQIKEMRERLTLLQARMKEWKEAASSGQMEEPKETSRETEQEIPVEEPAVKAATDDKQSKYDAAYKAFQDRKYKDARAKFEEFIRAHPEDELTGNAYFWIAETYYGEKDFEAAILAYETVLKKYP
ncbi:MAG: tetratricopeptide repeat protein [Nitrospirota bacterium]